jgi:hypothetical protein
MPEASQPTPEALRPTAVQELNAYADSLFPDQAALEPQQVTKYVGGHVSSPLIITRNPNGAYSIATQTINVNTGDVTMGYQLAIVDGGNRLVNLADTTDPNRDEGPAYQERVAAGLLNNVIPNTTDKPLTGLRLMLHSIRQARRFEAAQRNLKQ